MQLPIPSLTRLRPAVASGAGAAIAIAACLFTAGTLLAHDFWIVPNAFWVAPESPIQIRGQTGVRFPASVSAVAAARVVEARMITAEGSEALSGFTQAGTSLLVSHRPRRSGQYVIAFALAPRTTRQSAEGFSRYLALEGAADLVERYSRQGLLPRDSISMRSTKFAKTIVEVGSRGPRAFSTMAGHPLEIVPMSDPGLMRPAAPALFRVLFRGRPLADAHIHAGPERATGDSTPDLSLKTDASGVVRVNIDRDGLWNLRAGHAVPSTAGSGADWDVYWGTFVFRAGPQQGAVLLPEAAPMNDSAAVAATVASYHRALAAGDSAAALSLLAGDAIILESGGMETREEYRGHHLPGDIAFSRAVPSTSGATRVVVSGDIAWATTSSITVGQFNGRPVNSAGVELMVLSRSAGAAGGAWRIRAIHWSSRRRAP